MVRQNVRMDIERSALPRFWEKTPEKAAITSSMPDSPLESTPVERIANEVMVQITRVSTKTSKAPQIPCLKGCSVLAVAWAMGAVPNPASFESMPRDIPVCMALATVAPANPPATGAGDKACLNIRAKTSGISWKLIKKIASPAEK